MQGFLAVAFIVGGAAVVIAAVVVAKQLGETTREVQTIRMDVADSPLGRYLFSS